MKLLVEINTYKYSRGSVGFEVGYWFVILSMGRITYDVSLDISIVEK